MSLRHPGEGPGICAIVPRLPAEPLRGDGSVALLPMRLSRLIRRLPSA